MTNISHTYCSVGREYQKVMNMEDIVSYRCSEKKGISELDFILGILSMTRLRSVLQYKFAFGNIWKGLFWFLLKTVVFLNQVFRS